MRPGPYFKQQRPSPCPVCGARGLARYRGPETSQAWVYYPATEDAEGRTVADLDLPRHPCERKGSGAAPPAGALEGAIADALRPEIQSQMDDLRADLTEQLEDIAGAIATNATPKPLRIEITRDGAEPVKLESVHCQFPELLFAARHAHETKKWPVLVGAPGSSKSHTARQVAEALGLPFYSLSLTPDLTRSAVFGYTAPNLMTGQREYFGTDTRTAWEHGGVLLWDELDNGSDNQLSGLNTMLANGHASFPDGSVPGHCDFIFVGTANTNLRGGSRKHAGRRAQDGASLDRFAFIDWRYDDALEEARVHAILPGPSGRSWLAWIRAVRTYATAHVPQLDVTPRASVAGATVLAKGLPEGLGLEWIARVYTFAGIEPAQQSAILAACPLPATA